MDAALRTALQALRADFSGMVDAYDLPARMHGWLRDSRPDGWRGTAAALGSVGYFLGRCSPQRGLATPAVRDYLRRRCMAAMIASSPRLVQWRSILSGIPDCWLPEEWLLRSLRRQLAADERFSSLDLQLELRLANSGGRAWLKAQSTKEWQAIRGQLVAGRPCVVELIREQAMPNFLGRETLVVFAAQEPAANLVVLHVYAPEQGARHATLQLDFSAQELVVRESTELLGTPVRGLFLLDAPQQAPPVCRGQRLLRRLGVAQLLWWWHHRGSPPPWDASTDREELREDKQGPA
ncbi:hypothetical protein SAMN05660860_02647 [Geoalkalibacter ferrihydriticus]|uniref:Uncharacterized protein n=2 Tax=Geoalkalibacter ferrihydriticus TaxID=392333 RepID=A0A0C2DRG6_9BACT|nr:hypothetical protein [Geoalkalibacter ferrihydriticus]KIH76034.1 hypothetical protein GFER_12270 [Geoalkalibacter ferrihydriticus DSM 17813]SDM48789.1 hypothetical protein SAMN05660860_02647 [Geoalkalibacter ferrihydriticus]